VGGRKSLLERLAALKASKLHEVWRINKILVVLVCHSYLLVGDAQRLASAGRVALGFHGTFAVAAPLHAFVRPRLATVVFRIASPHFAVHFQLVYRYLAATLYILPD
jgi:hypothetical protein